MKRIVLSALVVSAFAAVDVSAQAPAAAPAADAAAPAPPAAAAAPTAADNLKEGARIVEVDANTTANLKKAIELLESAVADATIPAADRAEGYVALSRAHLRFGDLKSNNDDKIAAYNKGQAAGLKAVEVAGGKHAMGLFWSAANRGCVGRTRGVMNSLFMVGDLRKDMNTIIALNPKLHYPRNTLAEIDHAIPGLAGGSDERAEKALLEVLAKDPHITSTMFLLARVKRDQGKDAEAKVWAQKILDEKSPTLRNDWRKFDVPDAKKMLAELAE